MKIITSNSASIVSTHLRTTHDTIVKDVGDLPEQLAGELFPAGLRPTGPMMFLYDGVNADPHNEYDLRIALPLSEADAARYKGAHETTRLEPFHFVEIVLHGDLADLGPKAYEPIITQINEAGLTMTGHSREIYQNFIDPASADNVTRIQIGVVA